MTSVARSRGRLAAAWHAQAVRCCSIVPSANSLGLLEGCFTSPLVVEGGGGDRHAVDAEGAAPRDAKYQYPFHGFVLSSVVWEERAE